MEETSGRSERRATTVVLVVLAIETLWTILHKYLPLDASLWSLQSELVRDHLSGQVNDGWKIIPFPAANVLAPFISGLFASLFSGEITVRLILTVVCLFLRGCGLLTLFRTMRVRDEAVYYLIPVYTWSAVWFSGAMPYLVGETVATFTIAYLLSQSYPRSSAYWIISFGLAVTAMCHALAFFFAALITISITVEQRRSVHLSQGWLSSGRTVMSLLIPGSLLLLLSLFVQQPIFRISTSGFLPHEGFQQLLFFVTPAPSVLEATIKYGTILHGTFALGAAIIVIVCLGRAFLLPMEEVTWQSRSLKLGGAVLLVLSILSFLISGIGFDSAAWIGTAILFRLAGSYSRGPGVRRTVLDRVLVTVSIVAMVGTGLINSLSINRGSAASEDVLKIGRRLVDQEKQLAMQDQQLDSLSVQLLIDSSFVERESKSAVASYTYSLNSLLYLYGDKDVLKAPHTFQPIPGSMRQIDYQSVRTSPLMSLQYKTPERYLDPHLRVLAVADSGVPMQLGQFPLYLSDTTGVGIAHGEAAYRVIVGKLSAGRTQGLALR